MFNLDTGTAIAFIAEGSPIRFQLRTYVGNLPVSAHYFGVDHDSV